MSEGLGSRGLNDKQRRFADFILLGKTQVEAHKLAGYSGKSDEARAASACEILTNPNVEQYLAAKRQKVAAKVELTVEHFARRLERIASAAECAMFPQSSDPQAETVDMTPKEAADVARAHSMDAAKLLGLVIEKSESKVTLHEDRLGRIREKLNEQRPAIN